MMQELKRWWIYRLSVNFVLTDSGSFFVCRDEGNGRADYSPCCLFSPFSFPGSSFPARPFSFSLWICAFSLCISALFLFCGFLGFFCLCFWVGFFSSLLCFWVFLVFWVLFFFPPSLCFFFCFSLHLFHSLRSVFIVPESLRLWETKFQSNSFSFLKFEFD